MLRQFIPAIIVMISLAACQSSMLRGFEKVEAGMDKDKVLKLVGEPTATTRLHGEDRWLYRFWEDDVRYDREIHFKDELVSYHGDKWIPAPDKSAEVIDKQNAEREANLQAEEAAREETRKKNPQMFQEYEDEAHHKGKVEYMPTFTEK